jgi:cysteine desulfurase
MQREPVYLDVNATCPVLPEAAEAVAAALAAGGNPSSVHAAGRSARRRVERARQAVAALAGAPPSGVVFTSGASEANVLALRGLPSERVLVSALEHDSVLNAVPTAEVVPATADGVIDLEALRARVRNGDLVSLMAVNNETGAVQPIEEAARICAEAGARMHVDAVQAAGRLPLDFAGLGLAAMSLSAHKIGGPPGIGALIVDEALALIAQTRGGGQERGRRGGTENTAGIAGFGAAAESACAGLETEPVRQTGLRDRMEAAIRAAVPDMLLIAEATPRACNTLCLALPGVPSEKQVIALDLAGFAVSAGSACSSGKVKTSPVLSAMGLPERIAGASVRVSLGWHTTEAEADAFVEAYAAMAARLMPSADAAE